ncbi:MAG: sigma-54 dependent transcriptional regulator [Gemmatimonadota bacterium]|jgi:two-component system response regulator AtoC
MPQRILIVDDDRAVLQVLARRFEKSGWDVVSAADGASAIAVVRGESPDVVILDLQLPDTSGLAVLEQVKALDADAGVVILTGHGDIPLAVDAIHRGAENFLTKPVDLDHVVAVADRTLDTVRLRRRNRYLSGRQSAPVDLDALGSSPAMRELAASIQRVAAGDSTVLLMGETGTGKGWVAERIHRLSARHGHPFVEVNCGALTPTFLESELFGHERGAFTDAKERKRGLLEVADEGTVLLDEIGDLTPEIQPKLLKVLETRMFRRLGGTRQIEVDIRLIAATNRPLEKDLAAGRFRDDLYYRLAVMPVVLPPLRERAPEDIAVVAYAALADLQQRIGRGPERISDAALDALVHYGWPGNIRELRNVVERVLILHPDAQVVRPEHLPDHLARRRSVGAGPLLSLEDVERRHIMRVLEQTDGNRAEAARILGIGRTTLYDKIARYGFHDVGRDPYAGPAADARPSDAAARPSDAGAHEQRTE